MELYITEGTNVYTYVLTKDMHKVHILHREVYFIRRGEGYVFRISFPLACAYHGILQGTEEISVENSRTGEKALIRTVKKDADDIFSHYAVKKEVITIGSDENDDIVMLDQRVMPSQFILDIGNAELRDTCAGGLLSMHGQTADRIILTDSIRISLLALVFTVSKGIITIRNDHSVRVTLPSYRKRRTAAVRSTGEKKQIDHAFRLINMPESVVIELEEPLPFVQRERNPLIFMMGPALTMSMAAFSVGLLSIYNGWLNGRRITELMPMAVLPLTMVISALIWNPLQRLYDRRKEKKLINERQFRYEAYLDHLRQHREKYLRETEQRLEELLPAPSAVCALPEQYVYSKHIDDEDFLWIRLGTGEKTYDLSYTCGFHPAYNDPLQPMIKELTESEVTGYGMISVCLAGKTVSLCGSEALLYRILCQLTCFWSPAEIRIIFAGSPQTMDEMLWNRSIPHCLSAGIRCLVTDTVSAAEVSTVVRNDQAYPVFVVTGREYHDLIRCEKPHTELVFHHGAHIQKADILISEGQSGIVYESGKQRVYVPDTIMDHDPLSYYYALSEYILPEENVNQVSHTFFGMYGAAGAEDLDIRGRWQNSPQATDLTALLGHDRNGQLITLDLHESGQGPHGLIAGTTGSGKSMLLMTLILSLAVNYRPRDLQFVLIDFKGGGSVAAFDNASWHLPHLAGVLSNLDEYELERSRYSFHLEAERRERLFRELGDICGQPILDLQMYRENLKDSGLPDLCELVIIIDEFAELKKEYPEYLKDLVSMARVGRSLGIHLILSTQKPGGIVDEQIWANSRFKIALRVQDKADSKEILHTDEAVYLREPGSFILLCDDLSVQGQCGYVNALTGDDMSEVILTDRMLHSLRSKHLTEQTDVTQLREVMNEIVSVYTEINDQVFPLWLPPIHSIDKAEVTAHDRMIFGIADAFQRRQRKLLSYSLDDDISVIVFSPDRTVTELYMRYFLFQFLSSTSEKDEIYLFDDDHGHDFLRDAPQITDIIAGDQTEKTLNLFKHLEARRGRQNNRCILLITDLYRFLQIHEECLQDLIRICEGRRDKHIHICLFAADHLAVPYRLLVHFRFRTALYNDDLQMLSAIFETRVHFPVTHKFHGLIRSGELLEFCFPQINTDELETLVISCQKQYGNKKAYTIPVMPEILRCDMYTEEGIPLGMDIQTYSWITLSSDGLFVISVYEEETDRFYGVMQRYGAEKYTEETEIQGKIVFMTLDQYVQEDMKNRYRSMDVLFIGEGFHDQYIFRLRSGMTLAEDCGVLYRRSECRVIRYVRG